MGRCHSLLPRNLLLPLWGFIPKNPAFLRGEGGSTEFPIKFHLILPHPSHLTTTTKEKFLPHQGNRGVGFRVQSKSWERRRGSVVYFVLHFCISIPQPRAALVLTRSSGDPVLLLEREARAEGTRRRGGPPAAASGAESHHLFSAKRLRAWAEGAEEGACGGGEEEQHLLLLHASETPLQRRPRPTA